MKIKCFNLIELPVIEWSDGCGFSQEVFCWPVASDHSLRASIATVNTNSFLKRYVDGERLIVSLDGTKANVMAHKNPQIEFNSIGDSAQFPAHQYAEIKTFGQPVRLMNFIFRSDRWVIKSHLINKNQKLPINQAGLAFVLSGEWNVSGGSCSKMRPGQGGWWLPDIGIGELNPLTEGSLLVWIEAIPC